MPGNRNERLASDYREMLKIQDRPYCSWVATRGEPPYAEEYLLTIKLRTYALSATDDKYIVNAIDRCTVRITLWDSYPHVAPNIKMLSIPPVFHPNWYSKGTYCPVDAWSPDSSLKDYIKQLIGTIKYDPSLIESVAPANYKALDWFMKNRDNSNLFPSDDSELTENTPEEIAAIEKAMTSNDNIIDSWNKRR